MFKKIALVLLINCMVLIITSCSGIKPTQSSEETIISALSQHENQPQFPEGTMSSDLSQYENHTQSPDETMSSDLSQYEDHTQSPDETINFELSQYENHGTLSCGLIWVEKEVSDWNKKGERMFAYLDNNGNIKSQWFSLNAYQSAKDFKNGYVILIEKSSFKKKSDYYCNCIVYNTEFQEMATLNCQKPLLSKALITDFDSQGYAYALGYDNQTEGDMLYWIDSTGVHKFEKPDRLSFFMVDEYVLNSIRVSNGYFVVVHGSPDPKYLYTTIAIIYNQNGDFVFDIEQAMRKYVDEFAIISAVVLNDSTVNFYFYGANEKLYVCTMDFNGNFVQSPIEV